MGLVNELQESAERDDVATVLRKAKRLSSKLGREDISVWLEHEQAGYPEGAEVPDYRQIVMTICYNTNGYVPAGFGMAKTGIAQLPGCDLAPTFPDRSPIGTILSNIAGLGGKRGLYIELPEKFARHLRDTVVTNIPEFVERFTFLGKLNEGQLRNIPEQVKNRVLDWACKLESAGITGAGVSFSEQERQRAQGVVFNISHSKVDQITNDGTNIIRGPNG